MKLPSVKTLETAFDIDRAVAVTIREVLAGTVDPRTVSPAAAERDRKSVYGVNDYLLKLEAINELIAGFGVEHVERGTNAKSPAFDYINMGDTYNTTIVRMGAKRYRVTSWGDIVERGSYR